MIKKTGLLVGGIGLQAGMAAVVLYLANLAIWSILTAMLGGAMALIGMGLIIWALYPIRDHESDGDIVQGQPEAA